MDSLIQISKLNDFLYSPKSLYFHSIYQDFDPEMYHQIFQKRGKIVHETIDNSTYSSSQNYLQGIPVYSQKYNLVGKIDIYDTLEKALIERKYLIKTIHKGYIYQLWAQMFCLQEMGYTVKSLFLHSLKDNKRYAQELPNKEDIKQFEKFLNTIKNYDLIQESKLWKPDKIDDKTIYNALYF